MKCGETERERSKYLESPRIYAAFSSVFQPPSIVIALLLFLDILSLVRAKLFVSKAIPGKEWKKTEAKGRVWSLMDEDGESYPAWSKDEERFE